MFGGSPVLGHAILPMPSPPGSGVKPESTDTADSAHSEETVTAHGHPAEVPEEEVEEESKAVQDGQEPVTEPQPQTEQEEEIPEEGGSEDASVVWCVCVWYIHMYSLCVCGVCVCVCVRTCMHTCTHIFQSRVVVVCVCVCKCAFARQPVLLTNHCEDDWLTPHSCYSTSFSELTEALIHCVVVTDPGALEGDSVVSNPLSLLQCDGMLVLIVRQFTLNCTATFNSDGFAVYEE